MYWNANWVNFQNAGAWTTQKADAYPIEGAPVPISGPSEWDTAYIVNFGGKETSAYLDSFDVTVGSLVSANCEDAHIRFPSAKEETANFEVKNALKILAGESRSILMFDTSDQSTGTFDRVTYKFGSIEIGTAR